MNYAEIVKVLENFPFYKLPVIADDAEGHKIVITEGYRDVHENEVLVKNMHYFKVFTYLNDQSVKTHVYFKNGMTFEDVNY